VRVAATALGVLGLAGGVLAAFLLAAVGVITIQLHVSLGPAPYRTLALGLIALISSAAGLRGVTDVGGGRCDRGGLQFLLAGGGFLLLAGLLLDGEPLLWLASRGAVLGPVAVGVLFLLGAATAFVAAPPDPS
jgi:hypothetical protein